MECDVGVADLVAGDRAGFGGGLWFDETEAIGSPMGGEGEGGDDCAASDAYEFGILYELEAWDSIADEEGMAIEAVLGVEVEFVGGINVGDWLRSGIDFA